MFTWRRGKVLPTDTTKRFSDEHLIEVNNIERKHIFTGSGGTERELVCTLNDEHPLYKVNAAMISLLPDIIEALTAIAHRGDLSSADTYLLNSILGSIDREIQESYLNELNIEEFRRDRSKITCQGNFGRF